MLQADCKDWESWTSGRKTSCRVCFPVCFFRLILHDIPQCLLSLLVWGCNLSRSELDLQTQGLHLRSGILRAMQSMVQQGPNFSLSQMITLYFKTNDASVCPNSNAAISNTTTVLLWTVRCKSCNGRVSCPSSTGPNPDFKSKEIQRKIANLSGYVTSSTRAWFTNEKLKTWEKGEQKLDGKRQKLEGWKLTRNLWMASVSKSK